MLTSTTVRRGLVAAALTASAVAGGVLVVGPGARASRGPTFTHPGRIDNPYLPLTRFERCELRGVAEDGARERTVRTLQPFTRAFVVGGRRVEAVVIRDDAFENGRRVESTLDFFAQADDGTVFYFGEEVRNLRGGKVADTKGTWLYGRDTDRLGVLMPAKPTLGRQWHAEDAPGITIESDRVEEVGLRARVEGRIVTGVIRVQEFTQPDGEVEFKTYAPGLGVVDEYPPGGHTTFAGCR